LGIGLVVGLEGTGDSTKIPFTLQMMANMLKASGITIDSSTLNPKNVAAVTVTAELPPFASPGNKVDVQVSSYGDAKSLQGGILLQTPLYGGGSNDKAYVFAQGPVSIGGFQAGANGSSVQRNALCAGKVPDGGTVENEVPTTTVFDGKMYLELDDEDFTTAKRIAATIEEEHPEFAPVAMTAGKIQLVLPSGMPPVTAMAIIEQTEVYANIPAVVVINERTGTIVVGGNVRLGPAIVIKGGLNVRIETLNAVSQPLPFSNTGQTEKTSNSRVSAREDSSQMAVVIPNTTVADLARIFQELRVSATDMISILEELRAQGALKARIKQQ
jgi:flagellar P-ring protein precursor FlgI